MRLALALCIVVGCTMCGRALAGSARRRAVLLAALAGGLRLLKLHMTSMFETVQHALSSTGCDLLARVGESMAPGDSADDAWRRVARRERRQGGLCDALTADDEAILNRMFKALGESGRDAQELLLSGTIEALGRNLEAARARAAEADRLYVSIGMLIGLMLALMVI